MRKGAVVIDYLTAFCNNDVAGVGATLADDFVLDGPLFKFKSKQDYLAALADDSELKSRFEIIELLEEENTVSVYYDYIKPSGKVTVSQLFWFKNAKIRKTLLVFDGGSAT
ncbi:MAG: nuclear transport factor 2 family protein [Gammaproteobacteria bacterium]